MNLKKSHVIIIKDNGNNLGHASTEDSENFENFHFRISLVLSLFLKDREVLQTVKFLNKWQGLKNLLNESPAK